MSNDVKIPLLSIIVPVYNVEHYLKRCVDSILNQDFKDFEIILVDDGSLDKSGMICDEYKLMDSRIDVIHKKNQGLGAARNSGLELAKGEFVGFVDSDDWITRDMYSFLITQAVNYDSDIVSASYILTKGKTEFKQKKYYIKSFEGKDKIRFYMESGMKHRVSEYSVCNKIYRRKLFESIKFPEGQLFEDVMTNLKLVKFANRYVKSNKITYFYFQDSKSITRNGFKLQDYDLILVGKQMVEFAYEEYDPYLVHLAKTKEARSYFSMLIKIAVYGFYENVGNQEDISNYLTIKLRSNYKLLMKSQMPINRKILMTLLCIDTRIVKTISKKYTKIKEYNAKKSI